MTLFAWVIGVGVFAALFCGAVRKVALDRERKLREELEQEMLVELERLKSAFYSEIAHEMKTPLTVIAVNAQFAAQNIEAGVVDEEMVTDLNAISAEARRLAQMVSDLNRHTDDGENDIESEAGRGTKASWTLPVREGTEDEGVRDDSAGRG